VNRTLFWIGLAVAVLVAAASMQRFLKPTPAAQYQTIHAETAWAIGNNDDPFSYAGEFAHIVDGSAQFAIDSVTTHGDLNISLAATEALNSVFSAATAANDEIALALDLRDAFALSSACRAFGDSGFGDHRLPETYAQYAGSGNFELWIDGIRQPTTWYGFWSIAHALRQSDGSIRDQGLVFSPLLRDRSGFSDPKRWELTLLVYASQESDQVVLHLVFAIPSADMANSVQSSAGGS